MGEAVRQFGRYRDQLGAKLGIRPGRELRPRQRRLPTQVRLDQHRRHAMVAGDASPDDPTLADHWSQRRRKQAPPPLSAPVRQLLGVQQGRCTACGGLLLHADQHPQSPQQWEQWVRVTLVAIRKQHMSPR